MNPSSTSISSPSLHLHICFQVANATVSKNLTPSFPFQQNRMGSACGTRFSPEHQWSNPSSRLGLFIQLSLTCHPKLCTRCVQDKDQSLVRVARWKQVIRSLVFKGNSKFKRSMFLDASCSVRHLYLPSHTTLHHHHHAECGELLFTVCESNLQPNWTTKLILLVHVFPRDITCRGPSRSPVAIQQIDVLCIADNHQLALVHESPNTRRLLQPASFEEAKNGCPHLPQPCSFTDPTEQSRPCPVNPGSAQILTNFAPFPLLHSKSRSHQPLTQSLHTHHHICRMNLHIPFCRNQRFNNPPTSRPPTTFHRLDSRIADHRHKQFVTLRAQRPTIQHSCNALSLTRNPVHILPSVVRLPARNHSATDFFLRVPSRPRHTLCKRTSARHPSCHAAPIHTMTITMTLKEVHPTTVNGLALQA